MNTAWTPLPLWEFPLAAPERLEKIVSARTHEKCIQYRGHVVRVCCFSIGEPGESQWAIQVDVAKTGSSPLLRHRDTKHRFAALGDAEQAGIAWGTCKVDQMLQ